MKRIYKYPLVITDNQQLAIPNSAEFLSVIAQHDIPVMYFLVDPDSSQSHNINVRIVGTGHPIDGLIGLRFIGTVSTYNGTLIWHIFAGV